MLENQELALLEQYACDTLAPLILLSRAREIPAALNAYGLESYDDILLGIRFTSDLLTYGSLNPRASVTEFVQTASALVIALRNSQEKEL